MSENELKQARASFKAWYANRLCISGTYRVLVTDNADGLRYVVERNGVPYQIWKNGNDGYEQVF